ncbi:MAG: hypothetical protein GC199_03870 [Alphaproteobacteria bacterium]|nr:hypothetical protein [Alphaproteobacteria bacterium]
MSITAIARQHFEAARAEAASTGYDSDALARAMLSLAVTAFLERRPVADVRQELLAAAENVDPDTDYMFMRP